MLSARNWITVFEEELMNFETLDRKIADTMGRLGEPALRLSFAAIFVWFGILKPLGLSAAAPLVEATVAWMPGLTPAQWVSVIG